MGLFLGDNNIGRAKTNKKYKEWGFETIDGKKVLRNQPSVISDEINCDAIAGGSPDKRLTTPAGIPHSLQISTNSITTPGVIVSGLIITEQPAASAVEIFLAAKTSGKFQGDKAALSLIHI